MPEKLKAELMAENKELMRNMKRRIAQAESLEQKIENCNAEMKQMRSAFHLLVTEPMPEIQTVWLELHSDGKWRCVGSKSRAPGCVAYGPHEIVPGMLSLAELAARDLYPRYSPKIKKWIVMRFKNPRLPGDYTTPLLSQWYATLEARKEVFNAGSR